MVVNFSPHPVPRTLVFFLVVIFGVAALGGPSARATDLPGPVYELRGHVADASGLNLEGAAVTLVRASSAQPVANATTDAEGGYKFSLIEAGNYTVTAVHDCCLRASVKVLVGGTVLQAEADAIVLRIKEPVQSGDPVLLSGTVLDPEDEPMVGVALEVTSYYDGEEDGGCDDTGMCVSSVGVQWFTTESDATGAFELEVNRGWASLRASFPGFDTLYGTVQLPDDRTVTIPMRSSDDNTVRLHGTLRSTSGEPIADGWVSAGPNYRYETCPPYAACVASDSRSPPPPQDCDDPCWSYESPYNQYNSTSSRGDGSWELVVAAGDLLVQASAPEFLEDESTLDTEAGQDLEVQFALEPIPPDSIPVSGRVTDADSGDTLPFATINVENQKWGTWARAETDEHGNYELLVKPGYNILTAVWYPRHGCDDPQPVAEASEDQPSPMTVAAPPSCERSEKESMEYLPTHRSFVAVEGHDYEFDFELTQRPKPTSEFRGYVLDAADGSAIPNAVVTFYNEVTHDWGSAPTDEDGSYRIDVYAGYYSVRVWADDYFDGVDNLDIDADESQRADFELVAGEKRYGHWSYGGYHVAESAMAGESDGPPMPAEGDQAFHGSAGGLGPYHAESSDGANAPGFEFLLATLAAGAVAFIRRR